MRALSRPVGSHLLSRLGRALELVRAERPAGRVLRRLLLIAVVLPLGLVGATLAGQRAELFGWRFGFAALVLANAFLFYRIARWLDQVDAARLAAVEELAAERATLEQRVAERTTALAADNARYQAVQRELQEREVVLRVSERRFQAFMDYSPTLAWITDAEGRLHFANAGYRRSLAVLGELVEGQLLSDLFPPEAAAAYLANIRQVIASGEAVEVIEVATRVDGSQGEYLVYKFPIDTPEGQLVGGVAVDITNQREIEARLRVSLREKDVLLNEVHHRVKNNLQLIISLLRLQSAAQDPTLQPLLLESQQRIRAIALVHEMLYQSETFARVDIADYVRALSAYLQRSYGPRDAAIDVTIAVDELELDIDHAVPCGLILHELVSNAYKHAFPAGGQGQIQIGLHRSGAELELRVADKGIGCAECAFDRQHTSLGMQLVAAFAEQLGGTLRLIPGAGTDIRIVFPAPSQTLARVARARRRGVVKGSVARAAARRPRVA
jgi:PAS domain S-box-containing protein